MKKHILAPSILALFVASATHAGATFDTAAGTLYLGGDVEFDYFSQTDSNFAANGRLKLDINGQRALENGNFVAFKVNPIYRQNGAIAVDDAWIQIGVQNDWNLKTGHFEATDLSVAGQDTYVASTNTATMYRAKDARGRTNADTDGEAQVTFTKSMDAFGFELTAQSQANGDLVIARPVVTYAVDSVSVAVGAEVPVADQNDTDDWIGFGATTTIQATDNFNVTLRAAYKTNDTTDTDSMTAGIGAGYQNFYAAVLYGEDDADTGVDSEEMQVYASYKIPAVMDIDNFDIYFGAGYAKGDQTGTDIDDVIGAKIRLKYVF